MDPNSNVETTTPTVEQNPVTQPTEPIIPPPVIPDLPKPKSKLLPILLIILLIILMGVGGLFIYKSYFSKPTTQPINNSTTQPVSTPDPTIDWQTYTNDKLGFSFKYPKELTNIVDKLNVYTSEEGSIGLLQIKNFEVKNESEISGIDYFFGFSISKDNGMTLEQLASNIGGKSVTSITIDGLSAIKCFYELKNTSTQKTDELPTVIFKNNGSIYIVQLMTPNSDHSQWFDQILSTFKFAGNDQTKISNKKIGYIKTISQNNLTIDYIDYVENSSAPNGFTINNPSTETITLAVGANPTVVLQTYSHTSDGNFNFNQSINLNEFLNAYNSTTSVKIAPYWIDSTNGVVTKITEQYIP